MAIGKQLPGKGLMKGMGVTLKTLARTLKDRAETVQYPHEKEAPRVPAA